MIKKYLLSPALWPRVAQTFVGLLFLSSAYIKTARSLFGVHRLPLGYILKTWIDGAMPIAGYRQFLQFLLPYADALAVIMILCQGIAGILLIYNWRVRWAGALLLFSSANIFLANFHNPGLNWLTSVAMWIGLFTILRPSMTARSWRILTLLFVGVLALFLRDRYGYGDPWLSSVAGQRQHYSGYVMALTPQLKQLYLSLTDYQVSRWLWAGAWWIQLCCIIGLLTRYRLYFAAALLVHIWLQEVLWLSAFSAEGGLLTVGLFVWVTYEYWWQSRASTTEA